MIIILINLIQDKGVGETPAPLKGASGVRSMWEDGGSDGFEAGTNGGDLSKLLHGKQMVVRAGWGNSQEKLILFWETEAAGWEPQDSSINAAAANGLQMAPSFQHGFEGIARKIERRRKSDTGLPDTKEGGKNGIWAVQPQAQPSLGSGKGRERRDEGTTRRIPRWGKEGCALMEPSPQICP